MGAAIGAIAAPVAIAIAALAALVVGGVALYKNWDEIKAKATEIWGAIVGTVSGLLENLAKAISEAWGTVHTKTTETWNAIRSSLATAWQNILTTAQKTWSSIGSFITGIGTSIETTFNNLVASAFNWGRNLISNFIRGIEELWDSLRDKVRGVAQMVGDFQALAAPPS